MNRTSFATRWIAAVMLIGSVGLIGVHSLIASTGDAAGPPAIHQGDVWVDRLATGDQELKVMSVTPDTVSYMLWGAKQESDRDWNSIIYRPLTDAGATPITYAKPLLLFPFPLTPGKTWTDEVRWQLREPAVEGRTEVKGQLGDWADITVPAGTFRAISGEVTLRLIGHNAERDVTTIRYWYAPSVNRYVKFHYFSQNDGTIIDSELVSYRPAKS